MSEDRALQFRLNQQEVITPVLPANVNAYDAFNNASGIHQAHGLKPQGPQEAVEIKPQDLSGIQRDVINSINAPGQLPEIASGINTSKWNGNDMATVGLRAMETVAEFGGAMFSALTDKSDPGQDMMEDLERKLQMNAAPKPPQIGMGIGGGPG